MKRSARILALLLAGLGLLTPGHSALAQLPRARGPVAFERSIPPDSVSAPVSQTADSTWWAFPPEAAPDSAGSGAAAAAPDSSRGGPAMEDLSMALPPPVPIQVPDVPPLLPLTGIGLYLGYPSMLGIQLAAPADGIIAFRSGLAGLPGVGILWAPGFELRFHQEPGTFSTDSGYCYANLLLSRTYHGRDRDHVGAESGLGFRWLLSDRRAFRWIVGTEAGGYWDSDSFWPDRPSLRIFWMLAGS